MIDLKKKKDEEFTASENFLDTKAETSRKQVATKDIQKKENNAKKFLCVILSLVVVFVSVVCIFISKRNAVLLAEKKIEEHEKTTDGKIPALPVAGKTESSDSTESNKNSSQKDEPAYKTPKPGTLENPTIIEIDEDNWELTIVSSFYRIPSSYEPDLVYVCNSDQRLDRKVAVEFEKMYNAALKDGITLTPNSGYRSYARQERNYKRKIDYFLSQGYSEEEAKVKGATISMPPGSSEHNLGYAMDIVVVEQWFENTNEFKWLMKNAQDYGFILRYPEDKQDITNVIYEPWHWRYVGVENAKKIKESGLCLEEYLGVVKK